MRVSILIPCRNEAKAIERCLASALAQEEPDGGYEVLVIDGESDDGTRRILERMAAGSSRLRVIDNPRRIVPAGLNEGIRAARGEVIIRMDSHTEYAPDYVRKCVETLEATGADNVGGPARTRAEGYVQRAIAAAYHSPFAVGGARFHDVDYEGPVDTVTYGCWRRGAFERFGYFDEELVRNQDDEHNLRIVRSGGKVWQSPAIRSWYRPRNSLGALFRQYAQYGYWKVRVIQKHRIPASWRHLVPGSFVLALVVLGAGAPFSGVFRGLLAGLLAAYALAVGATSLHTAARSGWPLLPVLPAVFAGYHLGYGWGFLRGVVDFVLLRRGPRHRFGSLTR